AGAFCRRQGAARATGKAWAAGGPAGTGSDLFSVTIHQSGASTASPAAPAPDFRTGPPSPPVLDADELTILTSWAEAAADALAFAPERLQAVTADARTGASWRAGLRLPGPS